MLGFDGSAQQKGTLFRLSVVGGILYTASAKAHFEASTKEPIVNKRFGWRGRNKGRRGYMQAPKHV
jgi:hypothetical protein